MTDLKLVSAGDDIKLWDCSGFSLARQFNPHSGNVSSVAWSHDNQTLASASTAADKVVLTYTSTGAYSRDLAVNEKRTCLAFNSTSRYLMGGGADGVIQVWDLKTHKLKKTYKDHKGGITSLQFNWNDTYIASASDSGEIVLHNVVSGQASSPLVAPKVQVIRQIQYSHFKKSLLGSVSDDGAVNLWDTNTRRLIHTFSDVHKAPAMSLAFSPLNEMLLMTAGLDKRIICYDVQGKTAVKTITAESPLTSIDMQYDGATLAVGSMRGKIYIYDLRQGGVPVKIMAAHKSSVQCLAFQNHFRKADGSGRVGRTVSTPNLSKRPNDVGRPPAKTTPNTIGTNGAVPHDVDVVPSRGLVDKTNFPSTQSLAGGVSRDKFGIEDDVFSPIRQDLSRQTIPVADRLRRHVLLRDAVGGGSAHNSLDGSSENRPDVLGQAALAPNPSAGQGALTDSLFSPLGDGSGPDRTNQGRGSYPDRQRPLSLDGSQPITSFYGSEAGSLNSKFNREANSMDSIAKISNSVQATSSHSSKPRTSSGSAPDSWYGTTSVSDSSEASPTRVEPPVRGASTSNLANFTDDVSVLTSDMDNLAASHDQGMHQSMPSLSSKKPNRSPTSTIPPSIPENPVRFSSERKLPAPPMKDVKSTRGPVSWRGPEGDGAAEMSYPSGAASAGASGLNVQPFQTQFIKKLIEDSLEEFRDVIHQDVRNLHMEMLRQFQIQQNEVRALLQQHSVNDQLLAEVERLREENKRLKKMF